MGNEDWELRCATDDRNALLINTDTFIISLSCIQQKPSTHKWWCARAPLDKAWRLMSSRCFDGWQLGGFAQWTLTATWLRSGEGTVILSRVTYFLQRQPKPSCTAETKNNPLLVSLPHTPEANSCLPVPISPLSRCHDTFYYEKKSSATTRVKRVSRPSCLWLRP